jgi:NIPSNAP
MNRLRFRSIGGGVHGTIRLVCVASMFFLAGMLFQSHFFRSEPVEAASDRLYQLMIYHAFPDKAPALESIFRDVSKLQAKHGLATVGYWVPESDDPAWKNTFVYLVAHSDQESAKANWSALHADPDFPPYFKAAAPLIQQVNGKYQVDQIFMRPSDFSASK